jgi:5,10-methylenetetrahydromethanopterin reductase
MLQLAGNIADGVITHGLSTRHVEYVIEQLGTGAARPRPAVVLMLDVQIDPDRQRALDDLRPRCMTMAGGSYADELVEVYGLRRDDVAALRAAVRSGDRSGAVGLVTDDMVDAFGIAGPAPYLAERLHGLAESGVDEVILSVDGGDLATATKHITDLAKAVVA